MRPLARSATWNWRIPIRAPRLASLLAVSLCLATAHVAVAVVFTNDTIISLTDASYDTQEVVVSNAVLTVDGPHMFAGIRIASGAKLTHSPAASGTVGFLASVTNESIVLYGSIGAVLAKPNIVLSSVLVTGTNSLITYSNAVDYVVGTLAGGFTMLTRTTNSAIAHNQTVLVSYNYSAVTNGGLVLTITGNLEVEPGASIELDGRGFAGGGGSGAGFSAGGVRSGSGAGHGGYGGLGSSNTTAGIAYGSTFEPTRLGSGGGTGVGGGGGSGGGSVRLIVSNAFVLNGLVSANGANATNSRAGGGSGGSVWITAQSLSGTGVITANGGAGEPIHGGGGGGGRIAVESSTNLFAGALNAFGGAGWQRGGAGTVFVRSNFIFGNVTLDNGNFSGAPTLLQLTQVANLVIQGGAVAQFTGGPVENLLVRSNSSIVPGVSDSGIMTLVVQRDATIEKGASVLGDGKGYPQNQGVGLGALSQSAGSGAGHGGYGGSGISGTSTAAGGNQYGSLTTPTTPGSGGRGLSFSPGGAGGGVLRMTVSGNLRLDGAISMNGTAGTNLGGGGSGGSVWVTVGGFSGLGVVSADGGSGGSSAGGGGAGGRIAVYYASNAFGGNITAYGGNGAVAGGAGTFYMQRTADNSGSLWIDNGGLRGTNTAYNFNSGGNSFLDLTVSGGARFVPNAAAVFVNNLTVTTNSALLTGSNLVFNVVSNAHIAGGASISGDGQALSLNTGTGTGSSSGSGGGGHAGYGGRGAGGNGGVSHGSIAAPTSNGGDGGGVSSDRGNGGGAVRMIVGGVLNLDGTISVNGLNARANGAGGGAGGSISLKLVGLSGNGQILADGGAGHLPNGGGGAGGHISISCESNSFGGNLSAKGGVGFQNGGAGTIYLTTSNQIPELVVDNGSLSVTTSAVTTLGDLTIRGFNLSLGGGAAAMVVAPVTNLALNSLIVRSNSALLASSSLPSSILTITRDATVAAGGSVSADGLIFYGPGAGGYAQGGSGGGGHGGYGGRGAAALGGNAYDPASAPAMSGSSGGYPRGSGRGGGASRITVNGLLTVDGKLSANGASVNTNNEGGGSGGSIWLTVEGLAGAGSISADGGAGHLPNGGGGGGGRIAISYRSNSFAGTMSAKGGVGFGSGGAGTIYIRPKTITLSLPGNLVIDNGAQAGTNTLLGSDFPAQNHLTISGAAKVQLNTPSFSINTLTITGNSALISPPPSATLTISSNVIVATGSEISADGQGIGTGGGGSATSGSGGGGHGGYGGRGAGALGGNASDSASNPTLPGGAGGAPSLTRGGGALRMNIAETLFLDGRISANGANSSSNNAGGGAGGSIWITARNLSGKGAVIANGGAGHLPSGGGGGGGRVAVSTTGTETNSFTGIFSARGGAGFVNGGAGTIYLDLEKGDSFVPTLLVDNGGVRGTNTLVNLSTTKNYDLTIRSGGIANGVVASPRDLFIGSNAWLGQTGSVTVTRNATLEADGGINVDGLGDRQGFGRGSISGGIYGGGSHGGSGGGPTGAAYGSALVPTANGSGGAALDRPTFGSAGGGNSHMIVTDTLRLDGEISAQGLDGNGDGGGGSGGSLWVAAGRLSGSGRINAGGGNATGNFCGGGGGRIALYYANNEFTGTVTACGGTGYFNGGAGTIYVQGNSEAGGTLLVDNCGIVGAKTPVWRGLGLGTKLVVAGAADAEVSGGPLFSNVVVSAGRLLFPGGQETNGNLAVLGDLRIESAGAVLMNGRGFPRGTGPGAGASLLGKGAGGGYGGQGGASASGASGGIMYGSGLQPVDLGSGGGEGFLALGPGSEGGGAIRLDVGGTLTVDGELAANGTPGMVDDSGGGSGGSIWATARKLMGSGRISATGGAGELYGGGGGGGGRIALYSAMNTFGGQMTVAGGDGAFPGAVGSIFTSGLLPFAVISQSPTGVVTTVVTAVNLDFNSALNPSTISKSNVVLRTPNGVIEQSSFNVFVRALTTLQITFPPQNLPGEYRIEIKPDIRDVLGREMPQPYAGRFIIAEPVISGTITDTNGQPAAHVVLQATGIPVSAMTDLSGKYILNVPPGWFGTVTPVTASGIYVPASRTYGNVRGNLTNQNYVVVTTIAPTLQAGASGDSFTLSWYGIGGVTYQVWSSTNLAAWYPSGAPILGANGPVELRVPITGSAQKFFAVTARN